MVNFCPNCGKKLMKEDRRDRCGGCGKILSEPIGGWFRRLIARLVERSVKAAISLSPTVTMRITKSQEFRVKDPKTGEIKVYQAIDELPVELREKIKGMGIDLAKMVTARPGDAAETRYTTRDSGGIERTYKSIEELPAGTRALIENAKKA